MENRPFGAGGHGKPLVRSKSEGRGKEKNRGRMRAKEREMK